MPLVDEPFLDAPESATTCVTVRGGLDAGTSPRLGDLLTDLIDRRGVRCLVVDVEGLTFIDSAASAGLGDVLGDLIDGQGNLFVVVDLLDVVVAQPEALRVLVAARRAVEGRGGRFVLVAPTDGGDALVAVGLADVIEVHRERRHHPSTATQRPQ